LPHGLPLEHAGAAAQLTAEEDVLEHRELGDEAGLLVHGADASLASLLGRESIDPLAQDRDLTGVGHLGSGPDLDEGRLAGAVLAHEGVDLAGEDLERNVVERNDPAVALVDAARGDECCLEVLHHALLVVECSRST